MTGEALNWMDQGTALVLGTLSELDDTALDQPTGLPGWSRRHVLAHLACNAEALRRLAHWAATGEPTPMYESAEQKAAHIEQGSTLPAGYIRAWVAETAALLAKDLEALSWEAWRTEVVTSKGRTLPAREIPWLRAREVCVHLIDLCAGKDFNDLPAAFRATLLTDVTAHRSRRGRDPNVLLRATDSDEIWRLHGVGHRTEVLGTQADLVCWVTGRGSAGVRAHGGVPQLGAWL